MADEAAEDMGNEGAATSSKNNMAKQRNKSKGAAPGKGKRRKKLGSVVWEYPRKPALGPSYRPCPHIYFKHSVLRRSKLDQKTYDEYLATPKREPWKEPEEEPQRYRRRLLTPRTECLAMPQKRKMKAHLDEFADILTPQMVDNLEILLKTECELPADDSRAKDIAKKKAAKKAKKKKQAKKRAAGKKVTGAKRAVSPAKRVKGKKKTGTEDEGLEGEEAEAAEEEGELEGEAATEDETVGAEETEAEEETVAEEATEGETEGGEETEAEEGEIEGEDEGEEEGEAEAAEEKELTESELKLQEISRPIKEYAAWLQESLSKATLWAGWIEDTVAEAQAKAAKKKGAVLEKDGTPKKLTCKEWITWKQQLEANIKDWQSTKQDILNSANNWNKFMQIRADKIKAGESFTVPNPQAWQESFGKFSSPRVSKL